MRVLAGAAAALILVGCGKAETAAVAPTPTPAAASADSAPSHVDRPLKPEMLVRFPISGMACLSREGLQQVIEHGIRGEKTKVTAMMISRRNPNGECVMLAANKKYKLLSVEYNSDSSDIALLEVVGEGAESAHGAWAFSIGAEPVTE